MPACGKAGRNQGDRGQGTSSSCTSSSCTSSSCTSSICTSSIWEARSFRGARPPMGRQGATRGTGLGRVNSPGRRSEACGVCSACIQRGLQRGATGKVCSVARLHGMGRVAEGLPWSLSVEHRVEHSISAFHEVFHVATAQGPDIPMFTDCSARNHLAITHKPRIYLDNL